jgi:hypothetical protein
MHSVLKRAIWSVPLGLLLVGATTAGCLLVDPNRMTGGSPSVRPMPPMQFQRVGEETYEVSKHSTRGMTQFVVFDVSDLDVDFLDAKAGREWEERRDLALTREFPTWVGHTDRMSISSAFGLPFRCVCLTESHSEFQVGPTPQPSLPLTFRGHRYYIPLGIIWPGLLLNLSIASLSFFALLSGASFVRASRRRRKRLCIHCAYPTSPLTPICPECGKA